MTTKVFFKKKKDKLDFIKEKTTHKPDKDKES